VFEVIDGGGLIGQTFNAKAQRSEVLYSFVDIFRMVFIDFVFVQATIFANLNGKLK
jgi:hypothetical protein